MKKYVWFIGIILLVSVVCSGSLNFQDFSSHTAVYLKSSNQAFGYFDVLNVDGKNYNTILSSDQVIGEYVEISTSKINDFIKFFDVQIINRYLVSDRIIFEGISKKLPYKTKHQDFNIQISVCDGSAKIGSPALLDGF